MVGDVTAAVTATVASNGRKFESCTDAMLIYSAELPLPLSTLAGAVWADGEIGDVGDVAIDNDEVPPASPLPPPAVVPAADDDDAVVEVVAGVPPSADVEEETGDVTGTGLEPRDNDNDED